MQGATTRHGCEEYGKLFGEIPSAIENPDGRNAGSQSAGAPKSPSFARACNFRNLFFHKNDNNVASCDNQSAKCHICADHEVPEDGMYSLDEQSLLSALENMSFDDRVRKSKMRVPSSDDVIGPSYSHVIFQDKNLTDAEAFHIPEMSNSYVLSDVTFKTPGVLTSAVQQPMYMINGDHVGNNVLYQTISANSKQREIDAPRYLKMPYQYIYPVEGHALGREEQYVQNCSLGSNWAISGSVSVALSHGGSDVFHWAGPGEESYRNGSCSKHGDNLLTSDSWINNFVRHPYLACSCGKEECAVQRAMKLNCPYELSRASKSLMHQQALDMFGGYHFPENISSGCDWKVKYNSSVTCAIMQNYDYFHLSQHNSQFAAPIDSRDGWSSYVIHQLKHNNVNEVAGIILLMAKDKNGCRILQKIFSERSPREAQKVFSVIISHFGELMVDPFGNYLIQKLLDECTDEQLMHVLHEITKEPGHIIKIACNVHGTRAVQKVIEVIRTTKHVAIVISVLSSDILTLMTDVNGNHVVQRCLQKLLPEHQEFILSAAMNNFLKLARDRHGCCILQKCIEHSKKEQKMRLLSNIASNAFELSQDQFGNYVIQYILGLNNPRATEQALSQLDGRYGDLSFQKCSSNVVEKCLRLTPWPKQEEIIRELLNDPKLLQISLDRYGNYVIQTALSECKGTLHTSFVAAIKKHEAILRNSKFGRRVLSKAYQRNVQLA